MNIFVCKREIVGMGGRERKRVRVQGCVCLYICA